MLKNRVRISLQETVSIQVGQHQGLCPPSKGDPLIIMQDARLLHFYLMEPLSIITQIAKLPRGKISTCNLPLYPPPVSPFCLLLFGFFLVFLVFFCFENGPVWTRHVRRPAIMKAAYFSSGQIKWEILN